MTDPIRMSDDPNVPAELRELFTEHVTPPKLDAKTKAAALAGAIATGGVAAASTTAVASATTATGVKLWLLAGGLSIAAVAGTYIVQSDTPEVPTEAPTAELPPPPVSTPAVPTVREAVPEPREVAVVAEEPVMQPTTRRSAEPATLESLQAEAALLEDARAQLERDPRAALRVTRRHARDHPRGQLRAERELLAIQALVRMGRDAAAQRRARAFLRAHPTGIYADRARRVLE